MQITQYYVRAKTFQSSDSIKEGSPPDIWYYRLHESSRINLRMSGTLEAGKINIALQLWWHLHLRSHFKKI